jgi:hypothetical protein
MRILKKSTKPHPDISFIFLDWSVRESFHILHYLSRQTIDRDRFEVVVIEYYSRVSEAIRKYEEQVDTWVLLEIPKEYYYHKHLMYNAGIVLSQGRILAIGDSDAMARETLVESIIRAFSRDQNTVLHIDQFRNNRRDMYPFSFPSFDKVLGDGCINNVNGKTSGLCDTTDPLHTRNYGACMCASRNDLIAIGGADEHIDYLGHICGPYDMTFRLINSGQREIWLEDEFTYHTWHPGQAGDDNYLGPHDGRHMSTTALRALLSGRVLPLVENNAISQLRLGATSQDAVLIEKIVDFDRVNLWRKNKLSDITRSGCQVVQFIESFRGARIFQDKQRFTAKWIAEIPTCRHKSDPPLSSHSFSSILEAKKTISEYLPFGLTLRLRLFATLALMWRLAGFLWQAVRAGRRVLRLRPRKISDYIGRSLKERVFHSSDAANLIVLLVTRRSKPICSKPKVVILGKGDALIMRLFIWLRILPTAMVIEAKDRDSARQVAASITEGDGAVLLSGNAYVRFYSDFAACPHDKVVIV